MVRVLRKRGLFTIQAIKSALHVLIDTCPLGRNRTRIVKAGRVTELIEIELEKPEQNVTELVFNLLAHLCSCADGEEFNFERVCFRNVEGWSCFEALHGMLNLQSKIKSQL